MEQVERGGDNHMVWRVKGEKRRPQKIPIWNLGQYSDQGKEKAKTGHIKEVGQTIVGWWTGMHIVYIEQGEKKVWWKIWEGY